MTAANTPRSGGGTATGAMPFPEPASPYRHTLAYLAAEAPLLYLGVRSGLNGDSSLPPHRRGQGFASGPDAAEPRGAGPHPARTCGAAAVAVVVVAAIALLLAAACTGAGARRGGDVPVVAQSSAHQPPADASSEPSSEDGPGTAASTSPAPAARTTAEAFVRAWAHPDLPASIWLAGVTPYAAPGYTTLLRTVDPGTIPARTVTGPGAAVFSTAAVTVYAVPTDAGTLLVTCNLLNGRWLVTGMQPQPPEHHR
jgi:hypothetical protein